MRASVCLQTPDGSTHLLLPGDVIGRMKSAALVLDDPRVSEAHALVSLRDGELRLLALRGAFALDGRPLSEAVLQVGQRLQVARGLSLLVTEVHLPAVVLGIEGPGLPRQALPAVSSLRWSQGPRLVQGWQEDASAWIWFDGEGFRIQEPTGPPRSLNANDEVVVGEARLRCVLLELGAAGPAATHQAGGVDAPLRLIAHYDTVEIHREGRPALTLSGVLARLVSELVVLQGPIHWESLSKELWTDVDDSAVLRSRLDANLNRLRRRLKEASIRTDLVTSDGAGSLLLLRYPHDEVEDHT